MTKLEFELDYAQTNNLPTSDKGIIWTPKMIARYWLDFQESWETFLFFKDVLDSRPMPNWFNEVWDGYPTAQ
jgi:hypothetical protein